MPKLLLRAPTWKWNLQKHATNGMGLVCQPRKHKQLLFLLVPTESKLIDTNLCKSLAKSHRETWTKISCVSFSHVSCSEPKPRLASCISAGRDHCHTFKCYGCVWGGEKYNPWECPSHWGGVISCLTILCLCLQSLSMPLKENASKKNILIFLNVSHKILHHK